MKRILALVLSLSLLLSLCVCAVAEGDEKLVYFCVSNLTHPFSEASVKELNKKVADLGLNWKVVVADGQGDQNIQLQTIEDAISKGADAIIWKPVTSETASACAKIIMDAGIPSICVNRGVTDGDVTCLIMGENTQIGEFVARDMAARLEGKGKVALVEGKLGSADSEDRKVLFEKVISEEFPDISIVADQAGNWSKDTALKIAEDVLIRYPDIAAFYCANDEMAQGVVLAVENAGLTGKVLIYGVDCYKSSLDMIGQGLMTGTVIFPTSLATAVEIAAQIFENGSYDGEKIVYDDVIMITPENYTEYYDKALEA